MTASARDPDGQTRVALVTGGTQGIGFSVAERLAHAGFDLALGWWGDAGDVADTARSLSLASGSAVVPFEVDLGDRAQARSLVARVEDRFARVDVLVNNAGIYVPSDWDAISDGDWDRTFDVNLYSGYLLARTAAAGMARRGWGRIVFTASSTALTGSPRLLAYSASKAALSGLVRSLATTLGDDGITVNAVTTGRTLTEGLEAFIERGETTLEESQRSRDSQPIKRLAVPTDISGAYLFLVSDDAAYMTGQMLNVDGGRHFL